MAMTLEQEREAFEKWYVENAFDYEANPLGSRDCGLQWKAWQAARTTQPAPLITDEAVERLAQHIYEQEARNRCKTIDEAVFHRSKWRRAIPEARAMLEATFPAHLTQPAQAVDVVAIREVIESLLVWPSTSNKNMAAKLTHSLAGEQAGWRVPDELPEDDPVDADRRGEILSDYQWGYNQGWNDCRYETLNPLPASPTPDKETQR